MPDGYFVGVHTDVVTHNDAVENCPDLSTADNRQHCADWEINLLPDANLRHLLARDESSLNDRDGGDCQSKHSEYRQGNSVADIRGAIGIEGEQWYYPVGFRPEAGDRAVARGLWVIDCGHPDWHSELHPASLLASSYLQTNDYAPVLGATWNRPLRLTSNWRSITGGAPAVVTKIVASSVFAEHSLEVDVWPPARPSACARLVVARERNTRRNGRGVHRGEFLPADGNPNHLHLSITHPRSIWNSGATVTPEPRLVTYLYTACGMVTRDVCSDAARQGKGAGLSRRGPIDWQMSPSRWLLREFTPPGVTPLAALTATALVVAKSVLGTGGRPPARPVPAVRSTSRRASPSLCHQWTRRG
jgi:hypothetical protein